MKKILFILFILISAATFGQPYTYHLRYDSVKFVTANNSEFILKSSTRDSTNGILLNIGGGITQFKRIRAISATKFTVGTDTITITGSGGSGSGTLTTITATNNTGQTWTITNPATTPNLSLALTSAAVGLSNVDNTSDANKPISSATQTALNLKQNTLSEGYGIDITSNVVTADTGVLGPLWRSQISIPNLIIQPAGSGINPWYASGDSLYLKKHFNTYGLIWTTGTDSSMLATIDSTKYVPKETTSQITGAKTFLLDVTIQKNGGSPYLVLNRMGTTTSQDDGGIQFKDNSTIKQYIWLQNFSDTAYPLKFGSGTAAKSWNVDEKFGSMSLGYSTFSRGYAWDVSHNTGNYGADSSLIMGALRYRFTNATSNLIDSFKVDRFANLTISGNITAEIDSTGTARNMLYQGANGMIYRAAIPSGGAADSDATLTFTDITTNNSSTTKHGFLKKLSNTATEYMDGTGNWSTPAGSGGGITGSQVNGYVRGAFYNISAGLGSTVKYVTFGKGQVDITGAASNMVDNRISLSVIDIIETTTITGVTWWQTTAGNFTADNYNGVALLQLNESTGLMTTVASSTDDGNIWKATSATWNSKAFSSTYSASPGRYYVAAVWNNSANTTAPQIGQFTALSAINISQSGFANSQKLSHYILGNTIPATIASSATTAVTNLNALFLY